MALLTLDHVMHGGRDRVFLQWTVDPGTGPAFLSFQVQRAAQHGGDYTPVATVDDLYYVDDIGSEANQAQELNILSETRSLVYRIIGVRDTTDPKLRQVTSNELDTRGNSGVSVTSVQGVGFVPQSPQGVGHGPNAARFSEHPFAEQRRYLLYVAKLRRVYTALRLLNGCEVVLLKRRRFGTRCTVCRHAGTGHVLVTHCLNCYGTTWVGGFHTPLRTLAKLSPAPAQSQQVDLGRITARTAEVRLLPVPVMEPDDVIVDLDNDQRWIVRSVDENFFRKRSTSQDVACTLLARSAVEYQYSLAGVAPYTLVF